MEMGTENESVANRRKRLSFRSWHRGTKEADMLLGSFAAAHLETLDDAQLGRYEALLGNPDPDLFAWIMELREVPPECDNDIMELLKQVKLRPLTD